MRVRQKCNESGLNHYMGIAVTIFTTQIADIFGLQFGGEKMPGDFIGYFVNLFLPA